MIGPGGRRWWRTCEAARQLQVDAARIRDWVRRSKAAGHVAAGPGDCLACKAASGGFPHVDPPARSGRDAAYLVEQLLEAEAYTANSTRTGRIRLGA